MIEMGFRPGRFLASLALFLGLAALRPAPAQDLPAGRDVPAELDMVDVRSLDATILVDLRFGSTRNLVGEKLYDDCRCLLKTEVARAVVRAHQTLAPMGLRLKLLECYRPVAVQKLLWAFRPDRRFIADPRTGSRHNRGAAIDVTLVGADGQELRMGSSTEELTGRAYRWATGLGDPVDQNRTVLEEALEQEGFIGLDSEWWHFDHATWRRYQPMDHPLSTRPLPGPPPAGPPDPEAARSSEWPAPGPVPPDLTFREGE